MSEFRMPSLGADMEAGTLVEWIRRPGDRLHRGEAIAAVETQKGAIEIDVYEDGVLDEILVEVGARVPVGTVLARIRAADEIPGGAPGRPLAEPATGPAVTDTGATPAAPVAAAAPPTPQRAATPPPSSPPPPPPSSFSSPLPPSQPAEPAGPDPLRITPAARQRASELGLDPATLPPSATGVIGLEQVEAAVPTAAGSGSARRAGLDLDEMRRAIAASMARSWREIPRYHVGSMLDVSRLLDWLQQHNAGIALPDRLLYAVPLIRAIALALRATPTLNGQFDSRGFDPSDGVHLGIAVSLRGGGLVAPAILDADSLALPQLKARLDDLVARVRGGRLRSSEMSAASATWSNLGEHTADTLQPVIYPPQVAIIGCGQIAERAWARDGALSARRTLMVSVGGDHRVSDGRTAAAFIARLEELLANPERL